MSKKIISTYKFIPGGIPKAYNQYPNTVAVLTANRDFIVAEGNAYLTQQVAANSGNSQSIYYGYTYTQTRSIKCQRDIGYIVDAVIYDLTYGGNSATYQMASRFYVNGVLQILQPAVELALYSWLKGKIDTNILTNTAYTRLNSTNTQTLLSNRAEVAGITQFDLLLGYVTNVMSTGLSTLPTPIAPDSQNGGLVPNAVKLLDENKRFIQEETIAYIAYNVANNIAPYAYYTYNAEKCRRDVSYVLSGYISDLQHGGNRATASNANKYFEFGVPQVDGDRQPEIYAHTFIKNLIENNILPNVAFSARQTAVPQVIDLSVAAEPYANSLISILSEIVIQVITNGLSSSPVVISNRGAIKFPGFFKLKDILLITNTTRNTILYNFSDPDTAAELTYSEQFDSDFPAALYGVEKITTLTLDVDTTGMMVTDSIQIFVEGKEQAVRLNSIATDAMERMKVGIPQSMLDADFEYGLQPTKWQAISMMRNYPSVYEIPGSDLPVISVNTDASAGTGNVGASLITVVTAAGHGFSVNDVFTIKALAASVKGFGRAEGTFQVANVVNSTTFNYYAKSKVGTVNPTLLSSNYTQLRKAGYYTGASVGTPSFLVYSNGQSGTITTSLITPVGANIIGFSGTAPVVGAPLTGTGINSGTQITAVTGNGGSVAVTRLTSTAIVGATSLVVQSTSGISAGLVVNRGDGVAVSVTDIQGNTVSLSGALTSKILGTNQTYTGLTGTTGGAGSGATFDVSRLNTVYQAAIGGSNGQGYVANDTITIDGTGVDGVTSTNDVVITVTSAAPLLSVTALDPTSLTPGTGYADQINVDTVNNTGAGTGLTVDIVTGGGGVIDTVTINNPGSGYAIGDNLTISAGNGDAAINVLSVAVGGDIIAFTVSGTPVTTPNVNFISSFTMNDVTTAQIASSNTGLSYTSIATIEIGFLSAHGFVPGDSITVQINSSGSNAQLASGSYYVEQVPTATTLRYTARTPGIIANTLTGVVYARPDSYFVHRPYDGGVQLGTGGPAHGATAIRMSKKYIRYQSGKGVMYNTGALFAPSYDLSTVSANGTAVGSTITIATDDTDHGCQIGAQITITGVTTSGYDGIYTVTRIVDERTLTVTAVTTLGSTTPVLGSPCYMSVRGWHGATIRSGTFDDQNGMFWQYDGIRMALVKRSSTNNIAGTISIQANNNLVTGVGTRFTQQLAVGDRIVIKGMSHVISTLTSDTVMTVTPDYRGVNDVVGGKAMKTIDLVVPQESWNLDPLNGSGASGYTLDVTKMQMIGMQWTWYGAGFIDFMLRGPDGNYTFAHRFRNSNVNSEAYMRTGNQPVRYEVINEGAKNQLSAAINATVTTIPLVDAYWFPNAGTVMIDAEMIRYTGNDGKNLTGCTRAASLTQFVAGSTRTFTAGVAASHSARAGVVLVSNTITPIISHWGSAFMIDGQFDSDRGYLFNYSASSIQATLEKNTAFLIRLAPSVSNAQVGDLGDKELLNRAQLLLQAVSVTTDGIGATGPNGSTAVTAGGIVIEGILNPSNYPTDPTKITWTGLASSAAGGQPSFAQIAPGGSVTWSGNFSQTTATVQGAFTTNLTARSFAPSTSTLTAIGFSSAPTQTLTAASFGYASQTATALGFASGQPFTGTGQNLTALGFSGTQPYGTTAYNSATDTARNDILISNTAYDALSPVILPGDPITGTNFAVGTVITSITRGYNGGAYTRIVLSANPVIKSATSISVLAQTTTANRYQSATSVYRNDILITNTQYDALSPAIIVGNTITGTGIAGGATISAINRSYGGSSYTQIVMSVNAVTTSPAGSGNNITVTFATLYNATYQSALSSARNDFLISDTSYAALTTTLNVGDTLGVATYLTANQTINSITTGYITIAGTSYTRITMSAVANATSTAAATNGANNITVTATSAIGGTYLAAVSASRTDFIITQAQYASIAANFKVTDVLSASTVLTGSQTVSSVTQNYITIAGTAYARIIMSGNGNASSTTGSNVTVTSTSAFTSAYGSALASSRLDFLVTDTDWTASGIAAGDGLSIATYLTGGQTITSVTPAFVSLGGTSYTRVLMSGNANGTSTAGAGQNQTITVTAAGTSATYTRTNYLFFDSTSWLASGATIGTKIATSYTSFPAGTSVNAVTSRTYGATTVYRVGFTQSSNGAIAASATPTFQFGSAYALPGEQVFSFITNPGNVDTLDLSGLKELTSTSIGGRGTFPNGPDVLAINVYKVAGTATTANLILRWGEAQA